MRQRTPMPRVNKKHKLVYVYSSSLGMHEVRQITNKGQVSKKFDPQVSFKKDIREAFQTFTVPFAGFKSVPKVDKSKFRTWNGYIEAVWEKANSNH